jgi:hypothetical protein
VVRSDSLARFNFDMMRIQKYIYGIEDIFIPSRRFTPVVHQDAKYVEMFSSPDRAMLLSAPSSAPTYL